MLYLRLYPVKSKFTRTLPPMARCRSANKLTLLETSETVSDYMRDYALFVPITEELYLYMYYHLVKMTRLLTIFSYTIGTCMYDKHPLDMSSDLAGIAVYTLFIKYIQYLQLKAGVL